MPCDSSGSAMTRHKGPDDPAHLDFRAIYETANIGFLSGVIWGNSWVMRWRQSRDALNDTLRRLGEADNIPAFHRKRSPFDV